MFTAAAAAAAAGYLYSLPFVRECIVDILLGSPESEVRQVMADQLLQLSQLTAADVSPSPRDFLTQVSRAAVWRAFLEFSLSSVVRC